MRRVNGNVQPSNTTSEANSNSDRKTLSRTKRVFMRREGVRKAGLANVRPSAADTATFTREGSRQKEVHTWKSEG